MKNLFICLILFTACTTDKKEQSQSSDLKIEQNLIGTWTNVSLLVTMKRLEKQDSVLRANEGEWEQVLKIKPIETTFHADSTFESEYYTLDGQKMNTTYGQWWIQNDSLVMLTESGKTFYDFEYNGDRVRFRSTLDWDGDGIADDEYDGVQIRMD
ncbi:hypothetical protein [Reichenbachiella sp. MSK19-1]|uniref:hypothetical protein n=1 Tax=Reichenbachiella sp. MSK19-1 TaxID=1897631 RepID=UPI000E6BC6FB|nr:hypothetical protein [Reichenbachiella sp. MSK19-1]RJE71573.1 hypothetical protein BGP76_05625 [Reichenbachiella sp. MSK19-1]